jgi:hypothetical protein
VTLPGGGDSDKLTGRDGKLPPLDLRVDFGCVQPGSEHPMPAARRAHYRHRIEVATRALAAGAAKAREIFVR